MPERPILPRSTRHSTTAQLACAVMAVAAIVPNTPAVNIRMLTSAREINEESRLISHGVLKARRSVNEGLATSGGRHEDHSSGPFPEGSTAQYAATHAWEFDISQDTGAGSVLYAGSASILDVNGPGHSLALWLTYDFGFSVDEPAIFSFVPRGVAPASVASLSLLDQSGVLLEQRTLDLASPASLAELHTPAPGTYSMLITLRPSASGELPIGPSLFTPPELGVDWTTRPLPAPASALAFVFASAVALRRRSRT